MILQAAKFLWEAFWSIVGVVVGLVVIIFVVGGFIVMLIGPPPIFWDWLGGLP